MSDKYGNNNFSNNRDDMDDFFSQFDKAASNQNRPASRNPGQRNTPRQQSHTAPPLTSATNRRNGTQRRSNPVGSSQSAAASPAEDSRRRNAPPHGRKKSSASSSNRRKKAGAGGVGGGKKGKKSGSKKKRVLKVALLVILTIIIGCGIYVGIVLADAPEVKTDDIYSMLSQRSVMYDSEGNEIENLYLSDGNRTVVKYDEIPEDMINAVVAIEDKKFWTHHGFNFIRMLGAIKDSIFGGGQISGTSTVTQQLARNVYLADIKSQRSVSRKITEAYCTVILEKNLTKEQIMEAYLNTIYLGFNSYGIQAASQAYFSKNVQDLTTLECAALAALPQSPDSYALVKADYYNTETSLPVISRSDSITYLYNGDLSKDRRDLVLKNMEADGNLSTEKMNTALNENLQDHISIGISSDASTSSYFTDYAVDQLTDDIVSEYGVSRSDAQNMIYTGGLKIYTTMDSDIQKILEEEFAEDDNFSSIAYARTNSDGDLLNSDGNILLRDYDDYFDSEGRFVLTSGEYTAGSDGSLTILAGQRLNIFETEVNGQPDVSVEFKGMYVRENGTFYFIENGALSIPQGYKKVDGDGNVVISAKFFSDYPEFFVKSGDDYVVSSANYTLKQKIRQPQAAMTIMENSTGELKAMIGGRGATGKQLYNRATNPRQPGSSIKPIGVYGPALQMSYEYNKDGKTMSLDNSEGSDWGKYITAGSIINDAAMRYGGKTWPKNSYSGYRGQMTLRTAVQQSVNVCAVKVYQQIGPDYATEMLKKVGITTLDEEGDVNDLNPAMALGGLTNGITPLELTAAYATFPNGGVYKTPIAYTKVVDANDEVLFEKKTEEERVYNEGVAWIMTDILRTVVTQGIAGSASIGSQPVGGKTGTTNDNYDIWFAGFTPQYSAAIWMGNDVNIELSSSSGKTASFWSEVMGRVCADLPRASFKSRPGNVVSVAGEYYTNGTYSKVTMKPTSDSTEATTTAPTTKPPTTAKPSSSETTPTTESPSSSATQ